MRAMSRAYRVGLAAALAAGLLASAAAGQSSWQVQTIDPAAGLLAPPALVFDGQDRAQVVYGGSGSNLSHLGAAGSGPAPTWNAPRDTGISMGGNYGQTYLAAAGGQVYAVYRPWTTSVETTVRSRVFNGSSWGAYDFPLTKVNVYGVVVDNTGTLRWVVNNDWSAPQPPLIPGNGYYVAGKDGTGTVTSVPLAAGAGGMEFQAGADRVLRQGGQAVLDKYGNLHTIQYCQRGGGTLLYAKGAVAGPFSANDNFEMTWRVKVGWPSIAVDAAGTPHIVYTQGWPSYGLKHLAWTGSSWASEWVETGGSVYGLLGTFPQVLVGKTGVLHAVYSDLLNNAVKHAVKTQGAWQVETIDTISALPANEPLRGAVAAGMDSLGGIGVVYRDATGALKYAYQATPVSALPGPVGR